MISPRVSVIRRCPTVTIVRRYPYLETLASQIGPVKTVVRAGVPGAAVGSSEGGPAGVDFVQASALASWTIAHNLGHYPVVELMTPGGLGMLADLVHLSVNTLQVNFAVPTAGRARLV